MVAVGVGMGVVVIVGALVAAGGAMLGVPPLEDPHALMSSAPTRMTCAAFTARGNLTVFVPEVAAKS